MNKRFIHQLDEKMYPKRIMFGRDKISTRQSAGVDHHHLTGKQYGCVCDEEIFEVRLAS